jgi:hypothetical protein
MKKNYKIKFAELLQSNLLRPKQILKIEGMIIPHSGHTSCVYQYYDVINKKWYIGMHKDTGEIYWTSTTNKEFKKILTNHNSQLILTIIKWGSVNEMYQLEHELLSKVNAKGSDKYYNLSNGRPGAKEINYTLINQIALELDWIRDDRRDRTINDYKILNYTDNLNNTKFGFDFLSEGNVISDLYNYPKLQVRAETLDRENMDKIKARLGIQANSEFTSPPIFLKNRTYKGVFYNYLLISGNHTITSYWELGTPFDEAEINCIFIPEEIHEKFLDIELHILGNELNSEKRASKPFSKEDAFREGLFLYEEGNSWETKEVYAQWVNRGFTPANVYNVWDKIRQEIINIGMRKSNMIIMDYEGEHKSIIDDLIENTPDDIFACHYSSGAPALDRILISYWDEQDNREENKLKKHKSVRVYITHPNETVKNKKWPRLKNRFEKIQNKEKGTHIEYIELEMYTEKEIR